MKKTTIILLAIIGLLFLTGAVLLWQKVQAPVEPGPRNGNGEIPQGWKTYRNEELGFEVSYPGEWFVYDLAKFEQDNQEVNCYPLGPWGIENTVILSSRDLGSCIIFGPGEGYPGDFIIRSSGDQVDLESFYPNEYGRTTIIIDGVSGVKVPFVINKSKIGPRPDWTDIALNYRDRSYGIFLKQTDKKGNYNPLLDKILSLLNFFD